MNSHQEKSSQKTKLRRCEGNCVAFFLVILLSKCVPAIAETKTWTPDAGDTIWQTADAWTPSGVPTAGDIAVIEVPRLVILNEDVRSLRSLEMRGGPTLATGGRVLEVLQPSSSLGAMQLDGSSTQLIVNEHRIPSNSGLRTADLNLSGSTLSMAGGTASISNMLKNVSGAVRGNGLIELHRAGNSLENSNGQIIAENGDLQMRTTHLNGRIDLDGASGDERESKIMALDGSSTLQIDALLTDDFDGTVTVRTGNTIGFGKDVVLGQSGFVLFEGGETPATIGGNEGTGHMTAKGTLRVNSGTAVVNQQQVTFASTSLVSVNENRLLLPLAADSEGRINLAGGELSGDGTITNSGQIEGHGLISVNKLVNNGVINAFGGALTIETPTMPGNLDGPLRTGALVVGSTGRLNLNYGPGIKGFAGSIDIFGGEVILPDDVSLLFNPGGKLSITNNGTFTAGGFSQLSESSLEVAADQTARLDVQRHISFAGTNKIDGILTLNSIDTFVDVEANFSGEGAIVIPKSSRMRGDHESSIDVSVHNAGLITPGSIDNTTARLSFASLTNDDQGSFDLEIAGLAPGLNHDQLAGESLTAGGTLKVELLDSFVPSLGHSFQLLAFDSISGSFDDLILPDAFAWDTSQLLSSGTITVLDELASLRGDFNGNGLLEATDIDLLGAAIDGSDLSFDLTSDGIVDRLDQSFWVNELKNTNFGDADLTGTVEFGDFLSLSSSFGTEGGWAEGDFDGTRTVDFADFLLLSSNFGSTGSANISTVPEPSSASLLACGFLLGLRIVVGLSDVRKSGRRHQTGAPRPRDVS